MKKNTIPATWIAWAETLAVFTFTEVVRAKKEKNNFSNGNDETKLIEHFLQVTWLESDAVVDTTDAKEEFNAII